MKASSKLYPIFAFGIGFFSFLVGSGIYMCIRTTNLEMFKIFPNGLPYWLYCLRSLFSTFDIPNFVKYSLPDGLWLFSYLMIIDGIWFGYKSPIHLLYLAVLPIVAFLSEILQMFKLFPGTGDLVDILFYFMSILIFITIKYYKLWQN